MDTPLDDDMQEAIERFFALVNFHDTALTDRQLARFEEAVADLEDDELDDDTLMPILRDVIDWESGFHVDWKDTQSFIGCVNQLCERIDVDLDWGTDDTEDETFLEETSVPELMELAHDNLRVLGYTLWNWDTGGDAYAGWITRSEDDEEMLDIAQTLRLEIRPGDQPY